MTVPAAHQAVLTAKTKVADAETALSEALDARDRALADAGWRRIAGAFGPGVRLYGSMLYPNATLTAEQVVEHLEHQQKALA